MQLQESDKTEPTNNICVCVTSLHDKTQHYDIEHNDDLIRTPNDIYSLIKSKKSSAIQFYGETKTNVFEYFINILIDDMAYPFFENDSSHFINDKDPIVRRMLKKVLPKLQNFINIITRYDNPTAQRKFSLIIVPRLKQSWSLLWIQFTNHKKFINLRQIDTRPKYISEIPYNLKTFTRALLKSVLRIPENEEIILQYSHVTPFLESERFSNDELLISNIWAILKGYEQCGFNIDPKAALLRSTPIPFSCENLEDVRNRVSVESSEMDEKPNNEIALINTGAYPLLEDVNNDEKNKKGSKQFVITDSEDRQSKSESINELPTVHGVKHPRASENKEYISLERKKKRTNMNALTGAHNSQGRKYSEPYVTDKNLKSIKEHIPYDKEKLQELLLEFEEVYNNIQKQFYSRWSNSSPTDERLSARSFVFPMYGPTQIEYEILTNYGVVATKNLLRKLAELDIYPNKQQMRAISNARRWINQRFRCDFDRGCVYYLRNPHVLIPSYKDIPYIILATHLYYNCCDGFDTHNRLKGGWYISRKCVDWVISRCYKCEHKRNKEQGS